MVTASVIAQRITAQEAQVTEDLDVENFAAPEECYYYQAKSFEGSMNNWLDSAGLREVW